MDRIFAKKKSDPNGFSFMVFRQGNGYPCLNEDMDEGYPPEELLFPLKDSKDLPMYEAAALQGLLANPNIVHNLNDLEDEDFAWDMKRAIECLVVHIYYGDSHEQYG